LKTSLNCWSSSTSSFQVNFNPSKKEGTGNHRFNFKPLNVIAVNVVVWLMWSIFTVSLPKSLLRVCLLYVVCWLIVIIWLVLSVYLCTKVITLSGFHYLRKTSSKLNY
jgi:uncharacterized membrane-anchored protein